MKITMGQGQAQVQSWKIQGAGANEPANKTSAGATQAKSSAVGRLEKQVQRLQDRMQVIKSDPEKSDEAKKAEIENLEEQIKQLEAEIVRQQLEEAKKQVENTGNQGDQLSKAKPADKKDTETAFMRFLVKTDITKKRIQEHKITKAELEQQEARIAGEQAIDAERGVPVETEEGQAKQTPEQEVAPMLKTIGGLEENGVSALEENIQGLYGELNKDTRQYQKEIEDVETDKDKEETTAAAATQENEADDTVKDLENTNAYKQKEASEKYKQYDGKDHGQQKDLGAV